MQPPPYGPYGPPQLPSYPSPYAPPGAQPYYGHGPYPGPGQRTFYLTLKKHTGMLVMMRTETIRVQGTLEQCEAAYRDAQNHNLVAGWWGMFSALFMNWIAIFGNMSAIAEVRRLAASPPQQQLPR